MFYIKPQKNTQGTSFRLATYIFIALTILTAFSPLNGIWVWTTQRIMVWIITGPKDF